MRRSAREIPADIAAVKARIEYWRRTRARRTAMSEELWSAAVSLVGDEHTLYRVARDLGVDYTTLKLRVMESDTRALTAGLPRADIEAVEVPRPAQFVEVDPTDLFGRVGQGVTVVELTGADGAKMTMRVPAGVAVDVLGLASTFCRRS